MWSLWLGQGRSICQTRTSQEAKVKTDTHNHTAGSPCCCPWCDQIKKAEKSDFRLTLKSWSWCIQCFPESGPTMLLFPYLWSYIHCYEAVPWMFMLNVVNAANSEVSVCMSNPCETYAQASSCTKCSSSVHQWCWTEAQEKDYFESWVVQCCCSITKE